MIEHNFISPANTSLLMADIPDWTYDNLLEEIKNIEKDFKLGEPANDGLAGNIEREYHLPKSKKLIEPFIIDLAKIYFKQNQLTYTIDTSAVTGELPMSLETLWVNFQKKFEFNPNHTHTGILSFVMWIQVPYLFKDEMEQGPGRNSKANWPGCFEACYTDILGNICQHTVPADKTYEKKMLMFPARLTHSVYPFYTSDDYRITVSGNIKLKS